MHGVGYILGRADIQGSVRMDRRSTSQERQLPKSVFDAMYLLNNRIVGGLVSFGNFLMAGAIVGVLLAALTILFALSGIEDGPFVTGSHRPSAVSKSHQNDYLPAHNCTPELRCSDATVNSAHDTERYF
jgi:hypothetical protein